jgi:TonB family protein
MLRICRFAALVFSLAIMSAACGGSPPNADVDAANGAVEKAANQGADKYAADSLKAAQEARAALDAELKTQEGKWIKSYDKAKDLASTAKAAGDKAASDAVAGKERAEAVAAKAKASRAVARRAPVRVGGQIRPPTKIKDVKPVYPAIAQSARVTGTVIIEATIGEDGKVADTKVLRSVPLLDQPALDAVRQWQYMPTLLNGVPVPVVTTVTINFTR